MPCNCQSQIIEPQSQVYTSVVLDPNCLTTLESLNSLQNLIDQYILGGQMTIEDFNQLQVYRGQIISAINLYNYCYVDFNLVTVYINNVISKYI